MFDNCSFYQDKLRILPLIYAEVAQAEIIDWWDATRSLVAEKCAESERDLFERVNEATTDLTTLDFLNPWSEARKEVEAELEEGICAHRADLAKAVEVSLEDDLLPRESALIG